MIDKTDYRIFAEAKTQCSDGACASYYSDTAYNMPLQALDKKMTGTVVSIGEPFTYTITMDFYGNVEYTNTVLVDPLPKIDGTPVFSVTGIFTSNTSADNAWEWVDALQAITFATTSGTDTVFGRI